MPNQEGQTGADPNNNGGQTGADPNANQPGAGKPAGAETVTFSAEQQAAIAKMVEEATKKANNEAAATRVKLREIEKAKEEEQKAALEQQGKFKDLYEQTKAELDKVKPTFEQITAEFAKLETSRRAELLERIPVDKREGYKTFPLELLEQVAKDLGTAQAATTSSVGSTSGSLPAGGGKLPDSLDEMTMEQIAQLAKENPQLYAQMLEKRNKKRFLGA